MELKKERKGKSNIDKELLDSSPESEEMSVEDESDENLDKKPEKKRKTIEEDEKEKKQKKAKNSPVSYYTKTRFFASTQNYFVKKANKDIKLLIKPKEYEVIPLNDEKRIQTLLGPKVTYIYDKDEEATKLAGITESPLGGLGVVAINEIPKKTELGAYLGKFIAAKEIDHQGIAHRSYGMELQDDEGNLIGMIDAEFLRNFAGFLNHGHPNVAAVQINGKVILKTITDIPPGAPLLFNYGSNYPWQEKPFYLTKHHANNVDALYRKNESFYVKDCYLFSNIICDFYHLPKGRYWKITSLAIAILKNDTAKVDKYVSEQKDVPCLLVNQSETGLCDFKEQPLITPMQIAVVVGNNNIIDKLLSSGCDSNLPSLLSGITPALALLRVLFVLQDSKMQHNQLKALKEHAKILINQCTVFIDDDTDLNLLDAAIRLADAPIFEAVLNCIEKLQKAYAIDFSKYLIDRDSKSIPFVGFDYCISNKHWEILDLLFKVSEDNLLMSADILKQALKTNKIVKNETIKNLSAADHNAFMKILKKYQLFYELCVNRQYFPVKDNTQEKSKKFTKKPKKPELLPMEVSVKTEIPYLEKKEQKDCYDKFNALFNTRGGGAAIPNMIKFLSFGIDKILLSVFEYMKANDKHVDIKNLNKRALPAALQKYYLLRASAHWPLPESLINTKIKIVENYTEEESMIFTKIYIHQTAIKLEELSVLLNYNRTNKAANFIIPKLSPDQKFDVENVQKFFQKVFIDPYKDQQGQHKYYDWSNTHNHIKNPNVVYEIKYDEKTYSFSLLHFFKLLKEKDKKALSLIVSQFMACPYLLGIYKTHILIAYFKVFDFNETIEPIKLKGEYLKEFWSKILSSRDEKTFTSEQFSALKKVCKSGNKEEIATFLKTSQSDPTTFESRDVIVEVLYPVIYDGKYCFVLDVLLEHLNENAEFLIYWLFKANETHTLKLLPDDVILSFLRTNRSENFYIFTKSKLDQKRIYCLMYQYLKELNYKSFSNCKDLFERFKLVNVGKGNKKFFIGLDEVFSFVENENAPRFTEEKKSSQEDGKPSKEEEDSSKEDKKFSKEEKIVREPLVSYSFFGTERKEVASTPSSTQNFTKSS